MQEKNDEISRLRRELEALRVKDQKVLAQALGSRLAEMKLYTCTGKFTSDLMVFCFQHDLAPCAATELAVL